VVSLAPCPVHRNRADARGRPGLEQGHGRLFTTRPCVIGVSPGAATSLRSPEVVAWEYA